MMGIQTAEKLTSYICVRTFLHPLMPVAGMQCNGCWKKAAIENECERQKVICNYSIVGLSRHAKRKSVLVSVRGLVCGLCGLPFT